MISLKALRSLIPTQGNLTPDADQIGGLFGLHQRMTEDMDARNKELVDSGQPVYAQERPDPNLGTMSLLAQAIRERGGNGRVTSQALGRGRMFEHFQG